MDDGSLARIKAALEHYDEVLDGFEVPNFDDEGRPLTRHERALIAIEWTETGRLQ